MSPPLSNAGAIMIRAATSSQSPSSPNRSLPPLFVVLICASVLAIASIALCMWRKLVSVERTYPVSVPIARGRKKNGDPANGRPQMFDVVTERCTPKSLKWEENMPFSVTVSTNTGVKGASGPVREVEKPRGDSARGIREREKQDQGGCRLQVGVLIAMPSQPHTIFHDGVGQELSGSPLRDGLAIGLIEMPWIEEDRRLRISRLYPPLP